MQSIGGFDPVEVGGSQVDAGERVSGTWAWRDNDDNYQFAYGGPTAVKILRAGAEYDITPVGFTSGSADAAITSGNYGNGNYGAGRYGLGDEISENLQEAQSYSMDNYGEDFVFVANSDGKLQYCDVDGNAGDPAVAAPLTNAPTGLVGVVVTPENFVVALGAGGDPRYIRWADQDDNTDWTASPTNQAGDLRLPGRGSILAARRSQAETLVWTETDLYSLRYIGGTFIYSAVPVGAVGAISRRSMGVVGSVAFWMSGRGFYIYNGFTESIDSPLADYVFSDLNENQASKIWCEIRQEFGEVTWHYPSGSSRECDKSVTYNYEEGFWYNNTVARTAGEDRGALPYPMAFDAAVAATNVLTASSNFTSAETVVVAGKTYFFQTILTEADGTVKIGGDLETSLSNLAAAINLGAGAGTAYAAATTANGSAVATQWDATTLTVSAVAGGSGGNALTASDTAANASWAAGTFSGGAGPLLWQHEIGNYYGGATPEATSGPMELGQGDRTMHIQSIIPDEKTLGDVDLYLVTSYYPTATETTNGPYTPANPTDVRLSGRQVRLKIVQDQPGWRIGTMRLDVEAAGER